MQELFRDISGYEGLYQISNLGNVRSFKAVSKGGNLKAVYRKGYATVTLVKCGVSRVCSIHRLVAQAFIPNPYNLPYINHIDGNKSNNDISNLEWCTHLENMRHAFDTGLVKRKPLTDEQKIKVSNATKEAMNRPEVKEKMKQLAKEKVGVKSARHKKVINLDTGKTFISVREASKFYGIHESNLASCCRGERPIAGGYHWEYVKEVV